MLQSKDLPSAQQITKQIQKISLTGSGIEKSSDKFYPICENKRPGTKGVKRNIEVNYIKLNIDALISTAYHYDIEISPDKIKRLFQDVFAKFMEMNFPNVSMAFDGRKNAFAPIDLKLNAPVQSEVVVTDPENGKEKAFMVTMQEAQDSAINLSILKQ